MKVFKRCSNPTTNKTTKILSKSGPTLKEQKVITIIEERREA